MRDNIKSLIGWMEVEMLDAEYMEYYNTISNPNEWRKQYYSGMRNGFMKAIQAANLLNGDEKDKRSVARDDDSSNADDKNKYGGFLNQDITEGL